ncbi:hypothetical protein HZU38_05480 [Mycolicibacterium vanbaalenii]|uniref:hypothetical protein n=1 Tax=Mycolicibacterium vanbaalenii TaxID=110539 RepID=UPI001F3D6C77|nr:hypothetical protein [Mycolicibacterium vanbaalenii]UJL29953.1 hypothetical protein HZU38_05480 [Mycolicibacterium vanbaalenii]WND56987.1 hypothetical protein QQA43_00795 [Mycolicibacterium vanbaalenii]
MTEHLNPDGTVNLDAEPDGPGAQALAIVNCGLCDDEGYRGGTVCDHIDRAAVAKRGMQLVKRALEGKNRA